MPLVWAGLALAGVSTYSSAKSASDARSAQRAVGRAEKAIAQLENARTRRRQVREARIQIGTTYAKGATSGGATGFGSLASSGTQGKAVGVGSQLESNLAYLDEATRLSSIASDEGVKAATASSRANTAAGFAAAGFQLASLYKVAPD